MTRIRTDTVAGTLTDNPLTNVATTMNSAGLANLAAVSSTEAIITLDPNRINGAPEIVVVTAHTGSATSATIQRGQFGTAARQHPQGTQWVHGPIASNATSYATAADDQGDFVPMNAWESFTPVITQTATITHTDDYSEYVRIGRTIIWSFDVNLTSAGTAAGLLTFTLPVAARIPASSAPSAGSSEFFDTSATTRYVLNNIIVSSTTIQFTNDASAANQFGGAPAVTVANGDSMRGLVIYQAAS